MWRREPVLIALSSADVVIISLLGVLKSLGIVDLDTAQLASISAAILAITGVLVPILRANVVSPDTYENDVLEALWTPIIDVEVEGEPGEGEPAADIAWGGDV